jgi:hypothetical protein
MLSTLDDEPRLEEAYENLRVIRQVMERSTKHSSLSGLSGILVGIWAIIGVELTRYRYEFPALYGASGGGELQRLAAIWLLVLAASCTTDYMLNKRAAASVGKYVFSDIGTRLIQAASPGFTAGLIFTIYLLVHGLIFHVWGYWMLCYGLSICAVGLFSVRPVSYLGWAFVVAGTVTVFLPPTLGLWMMAATFGGFHICYGLYTGFSQREW